jgi:hypothetical protein
LECLQGKRNYRKLVPQQSFRKTSSDVKSHLEVTLTKISIFLGLTGTVIDTLK